MFSDVLSDFIKKTVLFTFLTSLLSSKYRCRSIIFLLEVFFEQCAFSAFLNELLSRSVNWLMSKWSMFSLFKLLYIIFWNASWSSGRYHLDFFLDFINVHLSFSKLNLIFDLAKRISLPVEKQFSPGFSKSIFCVLSYKRKCSSSSSCFAPGS